MADMIRKQIYISRRQEELLKRLSQARGVTEAEIVRSAIDRQLYGDSTPLGPAQTQPSALKDFIQLARTRRERMGEPARWNREELYEERENRWTGQAAKEDEDAGSVD